MFEHLIRRVCPDVLGIIGLYIITDDGGCCSQQFVIQVTIMC